jgi:hypothetical protein
LTNITGVQSTKKRSEAEDTGAKINLQHKNIKIAIFQHPQVSKAVGS